MMNIRMIVTDLDGTLLRGDKTISDYTIDVFQRCREAGMKIVFATARPKRAVLHYTGDLPTDALILHNGAVVYEGKRLLLQHGIASEATNNILHAIGLDYPRAMLSVEIDDTLYANFDVSVIWNNTLAVRSDFTDLPDKPADKIIAGISSAQDLIRYASYLPDDVYIQSSEGVVGMIMHRDATKENAVEAVAAHFGITLADVAAFGDDHNDVEMLRACGIGVAVANAIDEAKAVADYICGTNEDDGPAHWIETHLLGGVSLPNPPRRLRRRTPLQGGS